jgi:CDP-diacylglycerol---glycerol-3-phosphate 3-phosphatidyltransferase
MTIYDLKPAFQNLLRPLVKKLANSGVTANSVTIFALLLSIATGVVVAFYHSNYAIFYAIPVVMFVRMALNAIDGMLAREHHMKSKLGAFLNELCDVISDAALFFPFLFLPFISMYSIVLLIFLATVSEMTGVLAQAVNGERRYDGPMGKSDRAFLFSIISLVIALDISSVFPWIDTLLYLACFFICINIVKRTRHGIKENKS